MANITVDSGVDVTFTSAAATGVVTNEELTEWVRYLSQDLGQLTWETKVTLSNGRVKFQATVPAEAYVPYVPQLVTEPA